MHSKSPFIRRIGALLASGDRSCLVDGPEQWPGGDVGASRPAVDGGLYPVGNGNRTDMAALSLEIHYSPMALSQLEILESQGGYLRPPKAAVPAA